MRARYLAELSGPAAAALLAAEAQSLRYWRSGVLSYADRIADGFFEVQGTFPEVCPASDFPHLAALMQVMPKPDVRREVILVDRRHDRHLAAMREEARSAVARACGGGGGPPRLACFQALANVVAGHMGGALDSQPAAAEQWCALINRIKVQSASVVVPIGLLHMGAARHRALLFKVLAGDLGLPCRVVRGAAGGDTESARAVICLGDDELYIDLLARPGEVAPVPAEERMAELPTSSACVAGGASGAGGGTSQPGALPASAAPAAAGGSLNWSASLPTSLPLAGSVISQPLPSFHPHFSVGLDSDNAFGSAPLPPLETLSLEVRKRLLASSSAGPASRVASIGPAAPLRRSLPRVQVSEEERALLAALEAPGRRRPGRQASVAAAEAAVTARLAERSPTASHSSGGSQLAPQQTLPLPAQPHLGAEAGPAAAAPALAPALSLEHSSLGSQAFEHALNLAAAAAMGGDSLLSRPSRQGSSSRGFSTAVSATLPAMERLSGASTGQPEGPACPGSQAPTAMEVQCPPLVAGPAGGGAAVHGGNPQELPSTDGAAPTLLRDPDGTPAAQHAHPASAHEGAAAMAAAQARHLGSPPSLALAVPATASQLPDAASLPSPFGEPLSPFAAMAGFSDDDEEAPAAAAAEPVGSCGSAGGAAAVQAEGQGSEEMDEEDQGVELPISLPCFGRARGALPHRHSVEAEDALIEAALDDELGPAPGAGGGEGHGAAGSADGAAAAHAGPAGAAAPALAALPGRV